MPITDYKITPEEEVDKLCVNRSRMLPDEFNTYQEAQAFLDSYNVMQKDKYNNLIDKLVDEFILKQNATDETLETTAKTIVGAINEHESDITTLSTDMEQKAEQINTLDAEVDLKANKVQENWITPTLLNGWIRYSSSFSNAAYMKDEFGFVHIKGRIYNGTTTDGTVIFVLPEGYRPLLSETFVTASYDASSVKYVTEVVIESSGNVKVYNVKSNSLYLNITPFKVGV